MVNVQDHIRGLLPAISTSKTVTIKNAKPDVWLYRSAAHAATANKSGW